MAVGRKVLFGYADIERNCDKCHNLFSAKKAAWYIHLIVCNIAVFLSLFNIF